MMTYSQKWMLEWLKMSVSRSRLWKACGVRIMAMSSPPSNSGTVFRKKVSQAICSHQNTGKFRVQGLGFGSDEQTCA